MEDKNLPSSPEEGEEKVAVAPTLDEVRAKIDQEVNALTAWILSCKSSIFLAFEIQLVCFK